MAKNLKKELTVINSKNGEFMNIPMFAAKGVGAMEMHDTFGEAILAAKKQSAEIWKDKIIYAIDLQIMSFYAYKNGERCPDLNVKISNFAAA